MRACAVLHCRIGPPYYDMAGTLPCSICCAAPGRRIQKQTAQIFGRAGTRPRPRCDLDQFWSKYSVRHYAAGQGRGRRRGGGRHDFVEPGRVCSNNTFPSTGASVLEQAEIPACGQAPHVGSVWQSGGCAAPCPSSHRGAVLFAQAPARQGPGANWWIRPWNPWAGTWRVPDRMKS